MRQTFSYRCCLFTPVFVVARPWLVFRRVDPIRADGPGLRKAARCTRVVPCEGKGPILSLRGTCSLVTSWAPGCEWPGSPARPRALWSAGTGLLSWWISVYADLPGDWNPARFPTSTLSQRFYKMKSLHYVLAVSVSPDITCARHNVGHGRFVSCSLLKALSFFFHITGGELCGAAAFRTSGRAWLR